MKYIIRQGEQRVLAGMLEHLADAVVAHPQVVTFADYRSNRSVEQNSAYWAMLSEVRDWLWNHEGDAVPVEVLHMQMKQQFQPIIGSYSTQIKAPNGHLWWTDIPIPKSTTRNSVKEMAEYMEKVEAHWVMQGIKFKDRVYS